jgi:hypothetical protein
MPAPSPLAIVAAVAARPSSATRLRCVAASTKGSFDLTAVEDAAADELPQVEGGAVEHNVALPSRLRHRLAFSEEGSLHVAMLPVLLSKMACGRV